jgi:hypothetical protein
MDTGHLTILADHYRDTFELISKWHRTREWMFFATLTLGVAMLLNSLGGGFISTSLVAYAQKEFSITFSQDIRVLGTLLWFLWFGATLKYYQAQLRLENLYDYMTVLEGRLQAAAGTSLIDREGGHYRKGYPGFSTFSHYIYTGLVPAVLAIIPIALLIGEWRHSGFTTFVILDTGFCLLMIVTAILYLRHIHRNEQPTSTN